MNHEIDITVRQDGNRNTTRKRLIDVLLNEEPGNGKGENTSKYRYNVETLADGRNIYLTRPAFNKNGFDFVIHVEGEEFGNGKDNPAHRDIREDLIGKYSEDTETYARLYEAMCRVHMCEDPDDIIEEYQDVVFRTGLSIEALLKIIKWFFIEQDIRYWNYSGRNMFKERVID